MIFCLAIALAPRNEPANFAFFQQNRILMKIGNGSVPFTGIRPHHSGLTALDIPPFFPWLISPAPWEITLCNIALSDIGLLSSSHRTFLGDRKPCLDIRLFLASILYHLNAIFDLYRTPMPTSESVYMQVHSFVSSCLGF